jgi:hypothetical protein
MHDACVSRKRVSRGGDTEAELGASITDAANPSRIIKFAAKLP